MNKLLIIVILMLLALSLFTGCSEKPAVPPEENVQSGESDDFVLEDLDGNFLSVSDFKGKVVVLNFWASWCPPCRQEMPDLDELDKEFKEGGDVVLLTVNLTDGQRETREAARDYIEENGFGFVVLLDERGELAAQYRINAIPQTFILDRNGEISDSLIGATTKDVILDKVSAVK